ncbi:S-like ribonuclease, partial [Trifolium pratense]
RFGGIIRNTSGNYLAGFLGFIQGSSDILLAKMYAIYKGLLLPKDMSIDEPVRYSDSLHCVNLVKGPQIKYHIHAVLIQDIKELLCQTNVYLHHTLKEMNQCADFLAKLGASSDVDYLTHAYFQEGVREPLMNDAIGTFFLRE